MPTNKDNNQQNQHNQSGQYAGDPNRAADPARKSGERTDDQNRMKPSRHDERDDRNKR
jgi:hypothetical protein